MITLRPPINLATVDPGRPLSDHPRNRGVVAAWLALPSNYGGSTLYDLGGRYHGTLPGTPGAGTGIVRAPASRANGYGELAFDETSEQGVALPDMTSQFAAEEATIACWIRFRSQTVSGAKSGGLFDFGSSVPPYQIAFPFSDGNIYVSTFDAARPINGAPAPSNLTSWNHLAISSAAGSGNYKMYWNGEVYAPATSTRTTFYMPTAPSLGRDYIDFFFDGWMDDVWLVNRAWSDAEVQAHYIDSLASYPDALRRVPTYVGFASDGGGGGGGGTNLVSPEGDEMAYMGDFGIGQAVVFAPGTAGALASGAATVYRDGGTTKSTAGVTLTASVDGKTGYNTVVVDTSADAAFYLANHDYKVVFTAGTVGGDSIVGMVVGSFSLRNRPQPVMSVPFTTSSIKSLGG